MNLGQPSHILLLVIVFAVLFGAKKLPDSAKSIAQSLKIFKNEMNSDKDNQKSINKPEEDKNESDK